MTRFSSAPGIRTAKWRQPHVVEPGKIEIKSADDFVLTGSTAIDSATFTGLLPRSEYPSDVSEVRVEIYRVFPLNSDVGRTSGRRGSRRAGADPPSIRHRTSEFGERDRSAATSLYARRDSTQLHRCQLSDSGTAPSNPHRATTRAAMSRSRARRWSSTSSSPRLSTLPPTTISSCRRSNWTRRLPLAVGGETDRPPARRSPWIYRPAELDPR